MPRKEAYLQTCSHHITSLGAIKPLKDLRTVGVVVLDRHGLRNIYKL